MDDSAAGKLLRPFPGGELCRPAVVRRSAADGPGRSIHQLARSAGTCAFRWPVAVRRVRVDHAVSIVIGALARWEGGLGRKGLGDRALTVDLIDTVVAFLTAPSSLTERAAIPTAQGGGSVTELRSLATAASIWGSALVAATRLRQTATRPDDPFAVRPASSAAAPMNNLGHQRKLSDPELAGVAPNVDTLYSLAWLDTDGPPFVLETPNFGDRYYAFQIGYADSECDLCPGLRTHGPQLPPLFIHGPTYRGAVPDGMLPVASRTRYLMIAGRILVQPEDPDDVTVVRRLQQQIQLRTLPRWPNGESGAHPVPAQRRLPSAGDVGDPDLLFFHQLGCVLGEGVVTPAERDLVDSFSALGLRPGGGFDANALTPANRAEVVAGVRDAEALIEEKIGHLGHRANGWSVNLQGACFGDDYLLRAAVAKNQIYVVPADEAVYPVARVDEHGDRLDGRNRYRLVRRDGPGRRVLVSHRLRHPRSAGREFVESLRNRRSDAPARAGPRRHPAHLPAT